MGMLAGLNVFQALSTSFHVFRKKQIICFRWKIVLWEFNLILIRICFAFLPYFCCSLTLTATPAWKSREQLMCWYLWHHISKKEIRNVKKKKMGERRFFSEEINAQACVFLPVEKNSVTRRGWGKKPAKAYARAPPIPESLDRFCWDVHTRYQSFTVHKRQCTLLWRVWIMSHVTDKIDDIWFLKYIVDYLYMIHCIYSIMYSM